MTWLSVWMIWLSLCKNDLIISMDDLIISKDVCMYDLIISMYVWSYCQYLGMIRLQVCIVLLDYQYLGMIWFCAYITDLLIST